MSELTFTPMTDEDLQQLEMVEQQEKLLKECIGDAEFRKGVFAVSKAGNPQLVADFKVWDEDGKEGFIRDYLPTSGSSKMLYKFKNFCHALGLAEAYKAGKIFEADIMSREGCACKVEIGTQKEQKKPGTVNEYYPARSIIKNYIVDETATSVEKPVEKSEEPFHDDDIPF